MEISFDDAVLITAWSTLALIAGAALWIAVAGYFGRGPEDTYAVGVLRLLNTCFTRLVHRVKHDGAVDPLPPSGACIVVANHRSAADPFVLAAVSRRWIRFMMAREYYSPRWLFRQLDCIAVSRDGNDLGATRAALKALRAGKVLGIFPAGRIREEDDSMDDGKAGVALLALRTGAPVVPCYIDGSPATDDVARGLLTPSRSRVYSGEPMEFGGTDARPSREDLTRVTAEILGAIAALKARAEGGSRPGPRRMQVRSK